MQTYTLTFEIHEEEANVLDAHSAVAAMARAADRNCPVDGYSVQRKPDGTLVVGFTIRFVNHAEAISKQHEMSVAGRIANVDDVRPITLVKNTPA